jgi:hypothetical protein
MTVCHIKKDTSDHLFAFEYVEIRACWVSIELPTSGAFHLCACFHVSTVGASLPLYNGSGARGCAECKSQLRGLSVSLSVQTGSISWGVFVVERLDQSTCDWVQLASRRRSWSPVTPELIAWVLRGLQRGASPPSQEERRTCGALYEKCGAAIPWTCVYPQTLVGILNKRATALMKMFIL